MRLKSRQKLLVPLRHFTPPASSAGRNLPRTAISAVPIKAAPASTPAKIAPPGSAQFSSGTRRDRRSDP
jgi:hypothetical protein